MLLTIPLFQRVRHNFVLPREQTTSWVTQCKFFFISQTNTQLNLTSVSASKKTHFLNCDNLQQCSFVNVTPNSGLASNLRLAESLLSKILTSWIKSNTLESCSLEINELSSINQETNSKFLISPMERKGILLTEQSVTIWC